VGFEITSLSSFFYKNKKHTGRLFDKMPNREVLIFSFELCFFCFMEEREGEGGGGDIGRRIRSGGGGGGNIERRGGRGRERERVQWWELQ
jgi:hypothetical protein